ncbi:hypothetical protein QYS49_38615 [Marivirga salinae]|uniref:Uncharacterized protein n=1 Tax=Marivirga salinarum TaxID=3059078 RepID=A0AA51R8R9_9BACT|nr:hypothetical protein [Marivirga sp. BDSF4-3]WMN11507.1 hypothetical protein QYS49_38615 [Marivirga sp. BDSF4-3]
MKELSRNIRDLCNHPWKRELVFQDRIKWNKLWTSLDAIEDTQLAIDSYLNLEDFSSNNGGYLFIYGVMQALNIQQDAANNLLSALYDKTINFKTEYPDLYQIREHRNNSIGHPTKRGNDKSFHFIGRASIKKSGFTLASYYPKTGETSKFEDINIIQCIETQDDLIKNILTETMGKLESDFQKHKNKFKGKKLADFIHNDFHYEFSKLYENVGRDYPLAGMNFDIICEGYNKVKEGIKDRYFTIEALQGVQYTTQKLDYIFNRLKRDLIDNKISDEFELSIFIDALESNFKELQEMIDEIDKEFE